ncbi:hypothetical protein AB0383_19620 [Amycolatopsis sp. NPDC051373]|uniref:hypothetical protein n=1 Tax=Amycolatopsis sp. NPDC051373 TaxID=3155801 RepID=UPI00344D807A
MTDLDDALTAMHGADDDYCKAKAYSDGPVDEVFTSRRIRRLLRDSGVSFQTLLGDVVIDAVANKLKITAISSDNDERTKMLADVDEANAMAQKRPAVMRRALQLGDSYLAAWPVLDDKGNPVPGQVRVDVHDARSMRVLYDEDQPGTPRLAIQKWAVKTPAGKRVRVDLIYADRIEHFISRGQRSSKAGDFAAYAAEGRDAIELNPYGFPVFHFHGTGLPGEYGTPEHKSFYGTQNKLLKLEIVHMSGVDFHSLPQRVGLRDAGKVGPSSIDDLDEDDFLASPDGARTDNTIGDRKSKLSSEPGSVWDLEGYKDIKQLDPSNPAVFLDPRAAYLREGSVATSTPLHAFDRTGQIPSGESLKTANEPLDAKSEYRKTSFDATWRDFYRFVFKLLGEDDAPVSIAWAPIESTDETTKLTHAKQKQEIGVPVGKSLTEVGYKPEDVTQWLDDGDGGLPQRIELLAQLGSAVGDFASAVAAGLMDQAAVQQVITKLIGDVTGPGDDGAG